MWQWISSSTWHSVKGCMLIQLILAMMCRYCQRVQKPSFWGGESELYVISRMLRTPIHIYRTSAEVGIRYCSPCRRCLLE